MQVLGKLAAAARPSEPLQAWRARAWREAPTWLLAGAIYAGWAGLTWFYDSVPWWLAAPLGGWLVAWQSSFQHEAVHGHPSRHRRLNAALAWPPLGLWIPYAIYRDSHLAHHRSPALTDPVADPESFYVVRERWSAMRRPVRAILIANNTLAGRVIFGPWLTVGRFWTGEVRRLLAGDFRHARAWLLHLALCALVLVWVAAACGIPPLEYVLFFAWPGLSLTLLRSYTEHRPADAQDRRSVIVEAGPLTRLLFLNNNLHALHHARSDLPWHALPAAYRRGRDDILRGNGGFVFAGGYLEIARRFALVPKDPPVHPQS
jgi:fatty acid desaturase